MDNSGSRFANLEVDDLPPAGAPKLPDIRPVIPKSLAKRVRVGDINESGRARAQEDLDAAHAAGFNPKEQLYDLGTRVIDMGVKNFKASRRKYEDMPFVAEECEGLELRVQNEKRLDTLVTADTLTVSPDTGRLRIEGEEIPMTGRGVATLAGFVTDNGGRYLQGLHGRGEFDLLATNFNHHLAKAYRIDGRATTEARKAKADAAAIMTAIAFQLRTRNAPDSPEKREVFSVVGPTYADHGIDKIARQVIEAAGPQARGTVRYDGYRATIDIIFHSNVEATEVVCGEIFKAGVRIKAADDGSGSIVIQAMVWRNLCLNLLVIDRASQVTLRRRHVGEGIDQDVQAGIQNALKRVSYFSTRWSEASLENLLERYGLSAPEQVFQGLVENRVVHAVGITDDEMTERLMTAYRAEKVSYSKTAFLNAITRAAHTESWRNAETVEQLEETAGRLLYQRVWNVQLAEAA